MQQRHHLSRHDQNCFGVGRAPGNQCAVIIMAYTASRTWLAKLKAAAWAVPVAICFNDVIAGPVHIAGRYASSSRA